MAQQPRTSHTHLLRRLCSPALEQPHAACLVSAAVEAPTRGATKLRPAQPLQPALTRPLALASGAAGLGGYVLGENQLQPLCRSFSSKMTIPGPPASPIHLQGRHRVGQVDRSQDTCHRGSRSCFLLKRNGSQVGLYRVLNVVILKCQRQTIWGMWNPALSSLGTVTSSLVGTEPTGQGDFPGLTTRISARRPHQAPLVGGGRSLFGVSGRVRGSLGTAGTLRGTAVDNHVQSPREDASACPPSERARAELAPLQQADRSACRMGCTSKRT